MSLAADARAAAVTLLNAYATSAGLILQVYRARPASLYAPTAFVDSITERVDYVGPSLYQRFVSVELIVLHGTFDHGENVDQRDAFMDGFIAYVSTQYHAAGANTLLGIASAADVPDYIPDWLPPDKQKVYYATRITLEGQAET